MKLLGWMQDKLRRNSVEPMKDATFGSYCTCFPVLSSFDEDSNLRPPFDSKYGSRHHMHSKQEYESCFSELEAKEVDYEENMSDAIPELFHGFLTIGTLGSESIISEPATPTFTMPLENMTDERIEVTENELKLINKELEKFFEAEAKEQSSTESSARSSQVSTITLSGKQLEAVKIEDEKLMTCPLQGYLFGSRIDLPETKNGFKEKTSLAELFHRTKLMDESGAEYCDKEDLQENGTKKPGKHLISRILKKLHPFTGSSPGSKETSAATAKIKIPKVVQMFHRKIYPETCIASREFEKPSQFKRNRTRRFPKKPASMKGSRGDNSGGNGEHWIKTDDHCKYTPKQKKLRECDDSSTVSQLNSSGKYVMKFRSKMICYA